MDDNIFSPPDSPPFQPTLPPAADPPKQTARKTTRRKQKAKGSPNQKLLSRVTRKAFPRTVAGIVVPSNKSMAMLAAKVLRATKNLSEDQLTQFGQALEYFEKLPLAVRSAVLKFIT